MKKLFTLALTLFVLNSAFSQTYVSRLSFRTPVFSIGFGHRYMETYSFTNYERNMRIEKINAAYNQQVKEVMNLRIGVSKKIDLIHELEIQRANKIQNVNDRFFDARNKHNYVHYDSYYNWVR